MSRLIPGCRVLVRHAEDDLWHERILLFPAASEASEGGQPTTCWVVLTPDGDVYIEELENGSPDGSLVEWLEMARDLALPVGAARAYRFRQQPAEGCLSTLEAVAEALVALEGPRGPALKAALVAPFRRMVALQCGYSGEERGMDAGCPSLLALAFLGLPGGFSSPRLGPPRNSGQNAPRDRSGSRLLTPEPRPIGRGRGGGGGGGEGGRRRRGRRRRREEGDDDADDD